MIIFRREFFLRAAAKRAARVLFVLPLAYLEGLETFMASKRFPFLELGVSND